MFPSADPLDTHVAAVLALGIDPPPEWIEVRARFDSFLDMASPTLALLTDAVIDGADDDIAALRAQALAEVSAMPPAHAEVTAAVRAAVLHRLREHYQPHARPNYDQLAAAFDDTATKFTAAVNVVDPETEAAQLVSAPDKTRKAWSDAERYAILLTEAMARLQAAAALAGTPDTEKGETLIPLVADATNCHRRRVWEAWRTMDGRTKRWGALLGIGATLRAADLDHLEPYRLPRPMEVKQIPHGIGIRQIPFDPEDDEMTAVANS